MADITATKTLRTSQASASNTASSTTTGSTVDLTTALGGMATAKITNGGTGPTVGCTAYLEISGDNSAWKAFRQFTAGVTNSAVYEFAAEIPAAVMYARWKFTGNTGQTVTVEGFVQELTKLVST